MTETIIEKKHDLIRRIDENISSGVYGNDYENSIDYQKHIEILSNIENKCRELAIQKIKESQVKIKNITVNDKIAKHKERISPRELRKLMNEKYQRLLDQYEQIKSITAENHNLKKKGRELKEQMTKMINNKKSWEEHTKEELTIINEVFKF